MLKEGCPRGKHASLSCAPRLGLSQLCYILGPASTGKKFPERPLECAKLLQVCWLARASWRRGTTCSGARRAALVCVCWLRRRQPRTPGLRSVQVFRPRPLPCGRTCLHLKHAFACIAPEQVITLPCPLPFPAAPASPFSSTWPSTSPPGATSCATCSCLTLAPAPWAAPSVCSWCRCCARCSPRWLPGRGRSLGTPLRKVRVPCCWVHPLLG